MIEQHVCPPTLPFFHAWTRRLTPAGALDLGCGEHPKGRFSLDRERAGGDLIGDAAALPIRTASVPAVTAFQVLSYLDHPAQATGILFEVARVLVPGGVFVMSVGRWQREQEDWPLLLNVLGFVNIERVKGIFSYTGWRCQRNKEQ